MIQLSCIALLIVLVLSSCRTAKIYNVVDAPIHYAQQADIPLKDVRSAIIRAGAGLGWKMEPVEDGHILATLYLRTHVAVVDINYSKTSFSITYNDSEKLNYNGKSIHNNYNGWVQNLEKGINVQLSLLD